MINTIHANKMHSIHNILGLLFANVPGVLAFIFLDAIPLEGFFDFVSRILTLVVSVFGIIASYHIIQNWKRKNKLLDLEIRDKNTEFYRKKDDGKSSYDD